MPKNLLAASWGKGFFIENPDKFIDTKEKFGHKKMSGRHVGKVFQSVRGVVQRILGHTWCIHF